jgi:hypothetical protein
MIGTSTETTAMPIATTETPTATTDANCDDDSDCDAVDRRGRLRYRRSTKPSGDETNCDDCNTTSTTSDAERERL